MPFPAPQFDEVITFDTPSDVHCTLMIFNLHNDTSSEELYQLCSQYGGIHEVTIKQKKSAAVVMSAEQTALQTSTAQPPMSGEHPAAPAEQQSAATANVTSRASHHNAYAFVRFYSPDAGRRAQRALHLFPFTTSHSTTKLNVKYLQRKAPASLQLYPLKHHQCLALCNTYLGFNHWNCSIVRVCTYNSVEQQRYGLDELEEYKLLQSSISKKNTAAVFHPVQPNYIRCYVAEVQFQFPYKIDSSGQCSTDNDQWQSIHSVALSYQQPHELNNLAMKRAVSTAQLQVFRDLTIIRLSSGVTLLQSLGKYKKAVDAER